VAIDETELPKGSLGTEGDAAVGADHPARFAAEDFRLRLDSPLFHRDPGMWAVQAPQLRELTWEHVVRPTQQTPVLDDELAAESGGDLIAAMRATPTTPSPSIESLLEHARDSVESQNFVEQLLPVEPLRPLESLSGEVQLVVGRPVGLPVVELPAVEPPVVELPVVKTPDVEFQDEKASSASLPVAALYTIDDDIEALAVPPPSKPRVDTFFAALDQMDAIGTSAQDAPAEPIEELEQVHEPASVAVPIAAAVVSVEAPIAKPSPVVESAVEAELNRLAFLPDQHEQAGPVAVPTIAYTEPRAEAAVPSLSQDTLYTARNGPPPAHTRLNIADVATTYRPASRKKKPLLARLITFVVFFGILGGAGYAGKYYFLDRRWDGDTKALASEVEEARGLSFDHAVTVTTLPMTDYAAKLVKESFGLTDEELDEQAGQWRALGVLTGQLNLGQVGMAALPDSPAFYDPQSETIFVAREVPADLYRFGMHRALALALLDQNFGWSDRLRGVSASVARGTLAYYDADALATAVELATPVERTDIVAQIYGLYSTYQISPSSAPFVSVVAGRLGVALRPYFESLTVADRDVLDESAAFTDGQALDLRRLTAGGVESPALSSQGMLFWYHALAGRINENTAWEAALAWQNDDVEVVNSPSASCVVAHLQVAQSSLESVTAAFQAWAAAAPVASGTTVTLTTNGSPMQLQINACDPGPGVSTTSGVGYLALGGAPLRAEQYRLLVEGQPTLPTAQAACAVFGGDPVSMADERGVMDNAEGWPAPANHPFPDPNRLGCAPV